ncbi:hypothetical protein DVH05_011170 [Phytophthora capsici]|nr:hypothetical protein DVH05_011170 [Phytophthora capsici]
MKMWRVTWSPRRTFSLSAYLVARALNGRQPDIIRYEDCRSVEQFLWRQPTPAVTQPAEPDPSSVPGPSAVPNTDAYTPALPSSSVSQPPPPAEAVPSTPSVVTTTNSTMTENVFAAIAELARTTQAVLTQQSFQEQLLRRLSSSTGTDPRDRQHGAAVPPAAGGNNRHSTERPPWSKLPGAPCSPWAKLKPSA